MEGEAIKRLQIEIDDKTFWRLKAAAALHNMTLRKFVTRVLVAHLKEMEERK